MKTKFIQPPAPPVNKCRNEHNLEGQADPPESPSLPQCESHRRNVAFGRFSTAGVAAFICMIYGAGGEGWF